MGVRKSHGQPKQPRAFAACDGGELNTNQKTRPRRSSSGRLSRPKPRPRALVSRWNRSSLPTDARWRDSARSPRGFNCRWVRFSRCACGVAPHGRPSGCSCFPPTPDSQRDRNLSRVARISLVYKKPRKDTHKSPQERPPAPLTRSGTIWESRERN